MCTHKVKGFTLGFMHASNKFNPNVFNGEIVQ